MAFEEDFVAHLRARTGITAKTRHKIYPLGEVPQGTQGQYIVYEIDARPVHVNSGYGGITQADITVHCYGDGYKQARDLYNSVYDSIFGYRGTMGSSSLVTACYFEDYADVYERPQSANDHGKHRRSVSLTVFFKDSTPSLT